MPAKSRRPKFKPRRLKKTKRRINLKIILIPIVVTVLLAVAYYFLPSKWNSDERLVVVVNDSPSVSIVVVDPISERLVKLELPESTQIEAARDLGTWSLGSIWRLGKNENDQLLLQDSMTKTFAIPVDNWASEGVYKLLGGGAFSYLRVIGGFESNLSFKDKIKLANFSFTLAAGDRVELDLVDLGYLKKVELVDGETGYVPRSSMPKTLRGLFIRPSLAEEKARVEIIDGGSGVSGGYIADVAQVLGVKVSSVENEALSIDCIVAGENETAKTIAAIFNCELDDKKPYGGFDVSIRVGEGFSSRF